jgi:uncharacterized protein
MQRLVALVAGAMFAAGLIVSGMSQPSRIIGFLDIFGAWDPTLAFVMAGAIGVYLPLCRWVYLRGKPICGDSFVLPQQKDVTLRLVGGSALFGLGWGLGGFCPGPALTGLPTFSHNVVGMVVGMTIGMIAYRPLDRVLRDSRAASVKRPPPSDR